MVATPLSPRMHAQLVRQQKCLAAVCHDQLARLDIGKDPMFPINSCGFDGLCNAHADSQVQCFRQCSISLLAMPQAAAQQCCILSSSSKCWQQPQNSFACVLSSAGRCRQTTSNPAKACSSKVTEATPTRYFHSIFACHPKCCIR